MHEMKASSARFITIVEFLLHYKLILQMMLAIQVAEKLDKPPVVDLYTDVYNILPPNLQEQERLLRETIKAHPQAYPLNVPL